MRSVAYIDRQIEEIQKRRANDKLRLKSLKEEREAAAAFPEEPQWDFSTLAVQFRRGGPTYAYAFTRTPNGRYYSTGTHTGNYFESWHGLVKWVRGLDAYWVSQLHELVPAAGEVQLRG